MLNSKLERQLVKNKNYNIAIISQSLSDVTEIYNELAIAVKEISLEINTNKTKLLIQSWRADKQIHKVTLMKEQ